jgi:hypothetical protein
MQHAAFGLKLATDSMHHSTCSIELATIPDAKQKTTCSVQRATCSAAQKEMLEVLTGFETANKYKIKNQYGQVSYSESLVH